MNSWLNQGRLRRPGRGLKSKRIRQQTIQKTASHTEFLTLPYNRKNCSLAKSLNITLCGFPFLVSGMVHTPFLRSTCSHRAVRISPIRVIVDS